MFSLPFGSQREPNRSVCVEIWTTVEIQFVSAVLNIPNILSNVPARESCYCAAKLGRADDSIVESIERQSPVLFCLLIVVVESFAPELQTPTSATLA